MGINQRFAKSCESCSSMVGTMLVTNKTTLDVSVLEMIGYT